MADSRDRGGAQHCAEVASHESERDGCDQDCAKIGNSLGGVHSLGGLGALDVAARKESQDEDRNVRYEGYEDEWPEVGAVDGERLLEKVAQLHRDQGPHPAAIRPGFALGSQGDAARHAEARLVGIAAAAGYAVHGAASQRCALSAERPRITEDRIPASGEDGSVGGGRFNLLDTHRRQRQAVDSQHRGRAPRPFQISDHLPEQASGRHQPLEGARQPHHAL